MVTEAFSIRTESGIVRQLDTLAKLQDRSRNDLVNEAIENFLELHAWREERIRAGIEAADQGRFAERAKVERTFGKYSNV